MNKINFFTPALLTTLLIVSPLSFATPVTATLSFDTVPLVGLFLVRDIAFGEGLELSAGSKCTMTVSATDSPPEADAQMSKTGTANVAAAGNYQKRTNQCDNSVDGVAGLYRVVGGAGVPVFITVSPGTDGDVTFTPAGVAVDYDNATSSGGGDSFTAIASATEMEVDLATSGDRTNSVGQAVVGETVIALGGEYEALVALTANTDYDLTFDISVRY